MEHSDLMCKCKGHPNNCYNHPHECGCQDGNAGDRLGRSQVEWLLKNVEGFRDILSTAQ